MTKPLNATYVISNCPILDPGEIKTFHGLDVKNTIYLNSLLYSNWSELLSGESFGSDVYFCLDKSDDEFLPKNFIKESQKKIILETNSEKKVYLELNQKYFSSYKNNLLLIANSIGIKPSDINKVFSLLKNEDDSIVLGKSDRGEIVLLGFNNITENIFNEFYSGKSAYEGFLNLISSRDVYINVLEGFLSINDFQDLQKLYRELSKKESISYCSESIHERFNDLFIEYKDKLND